MKKSFTLFVFILSFQSLFAQLQDSMIAQVRVEFLAGLPSGDFATQMQDNGYGVGGEFLARLGRSPFLAGARFGYLHFSRYKIDVDVPIGNTGFNGEYDWITATQSVLMGAVFQVQPEVRSPFKPYLQLSVGMRRLYTNTRLENRNINDDNFVLGRDLDVADWSATYSGKMGFQIILTPDQVFALDIGCTYLYADGAEFYRKRDNPGPVEVPIDAFEWREASATSMFIPSIGFSFNIKRSSPVN